MPASCASERRRWWIFGKLLQALGKPGVVPAWHAANAMVNGVEPHGDKFMDV